jgi:hypothetical protein
VVVGAPVRITTGLTPGCRLLGSLRHGGRSGVADELGVYDDLLSRVLPVEWVEYGIVEHRYAARAPELNADLARRYGIAACDRRTSPPRSSVKPWASFTRRRCSSG